MSAAEELISVGGLAAVRRQFTIADETGVRSQWFESDPTWFQRAVFYEVHVRAFADGNDDGIGDFVGLAERLDYLQWLGVDCVWLLPMYPSPLRDGGYDISDFYSVHPDYGTVDDFKAFIDAAHERGIRVIADLVMNHTSVEHPWFQESRTNPDSPEARLVRVVRHRHPVRRRADHLRRQRIVELDLGPRGGCVLLAPVLLAPARPQLREPRSRRRDAQGAVVLARARARRLPPRRRPLSLRARRHELREPAGDPRVPEAGAQGSRRAVPRPRPPGRSQPVAARRRRLLRQRRRMPHGVPLPGDAADLHGHATRGRVADQRDPRTDTRDPGERAVGSLPAQPRRARRSRWSPTRNATTCTPSTPKTR